MEHLYSKGDYVIKAGTKVWHKCIKEVIKVGLILAKEPVVGGKGAGGPGFQQLWHTLSVKPPELKADMSGV